SQCSADTSSFPGTPLGTTRIESARTDRTALRRASADERSSLLRLLPQLAPVKMARPVVRTTLEKPAQQPERGSERKMRARDSSPRAESPSYSESTADPVQRSCRLFFDNTSIADAIVQRALFIVESRDDVADSKGKATEMFREVPAQRAKIGNLRAIA